jgi:hypothetical protein
MQSMDKGHERALAQQQAEARAAVGAGRTAGQLRRQFSGP